MYYKPIKGVSSWFREFDWIPWTTLAMGLTINLLCSSYLKNTLTISQNHCRVHQVQMFILWGKEGMEGDPRWWQLLVQSSCTCHVWNRGQTCNSVSILVRFIWHNRPVFQKYMTNGTFEHAEIVTREGAWGTQVKLYGAASYYKLPMYISHHTHKPTNIDGFFLSLSNVTALVTKKTLHYNKSTASDHVIPQEIILSVYST